MSQDQTPRPRRRRRRLKVWQRLFLAVVLLILLAFSSTLFSDFQNIRPVETPVPDPNASGWENSSFAYVIAGEGEFTAPFYNEALAVDSQCGRGTTVEIESWTPFVTESGNEFYHVFVGGRFGYIPCENISDDRSDVLQETQVYVRTAVNLLQEPDSTDLGMLADKGELLRIVGYDYLGADGRVNMYEVKLGTTLGWIKSDYVVPTYAEALENWNNNENVYGRHVERGDKYGGGDAATLDYWPHKKGDFSALGNVMPESCYSLYVSAGQSSPEKMEKFLEMAEGTAINTFVFTLFDDEELAYDSAVLGNQGLLSHYMVHNTKEAFMQSVKMAQNAGYYTVARITTFKDKALAETYPGWSITDLSGQPLLLNDSYWPSVFSREAWQLKVDFALEAVSTFGFNEVQFDYVRFPDYMLHYEQTGNVDLKNTYNESRAQAVQRFLIYATDVLHDHGVYVSADVFGETSNDYVAPYGQYWVAISTVVDVISGMPYPDHYEAYMSGGQYYRPYQHPYATLDNWAQHVMRRQKECSSPAIVRTWIQTWDAAYYRYDSLAIKREIVALYDCDITGGYMPWYGLGSVAVKDNIGDAIDYDYYALWKEATAQDINLSEYMGIDITDESQ